MRTVCIAALVVCRIGTADSAGFVSGSIPATYFRGLPSGATAAAIATDGGGNILIAGEIQTADARRQAFAAKYAPDGQTLLYTKILGSGVARAIAVDPAGNAYVAGWTSSADFPTSPGAWGTIYQASQAEGFVVKLDPSGTTVYSTLFGGATFTDALAVAVNSAGEAFVTGQTLGGDFPLMGGTITPIFPQNSYFLVRLSAAGDKPIYSVSGPGGVAIAVDDQNNVYTAGSAPGAYAVPITANAFQKDVKGAACGGGAQLQVPCLHQYVCKVNATASGLQFCTFVSGTYGEGRPSIAIDPSGVIYLTGTTQATDYPVSADALQPQNQSQLPLYPLNPPEYPSAYWAFQTTGYFTKLSADGTQLLYSTYLGGSQADYPGGIAVGANGSIYIAAQVQSPDYPGLPAAAQRCLPDRLHAMPVLTRLDSASASSVVVSAGATAASMALDPAGGFWLASGNSGLTRIPFTGAPTPDALTCVTDALDFTQAAPIVPGQLLTMFGTHIGPVQPVVYDSSGPPPVSLGGVAVTVDGQPAPLLYASDGQINLQVPGTIEGQSVVTLKLSTPGGLIAQRIVPVAALNTGLATNGVNAYPTCQGQSLYTAPVYLKVLNADATVNSCENPAAVGSQVLLVLNGAGLHPPTVTDQEGNPISAVLAVPGLPGVWLVGIQATAVIVSGSDKPLFTRLNLVVNGTPVREQGAALWLTR